MRAFLVRRVAFALVLVACASSTAFLLTRAAPGDLATLLGPLAKAGEVAALRERFGLDQPIIVQWAHWASRAVRLDLGESFLYNRPVISVLGPAALNTAILAIVALTLATASGIFLGVVSGSGGRTVARTVIRLLSALCVSLPPLLTSLIFVFIAARTGIVPAGGMSSASAGDLSWAAWLADVAWHIPLPALALALPIAATFERLQSQALTEVVDQPFVTAARARGVPGPALIWRHAWPASLRPICAVLGVAIGVLLSGSFVVEYVTTWPGLGRLMYEALRARDIYLVAGCAAAGSALLACGTLAGDLLLAAVDPRVREETGA
ncbi:MAG TPA: ABC transporter permease [Vicinamibacterales bacterium]|jgi:peptide/nickel transport system permease protein|nr:ABC transporter permease [Vicinamibacterales bacterium]